MNTTLAFSEDLRRYEDEKSFTFIGFPNLPDEWHSNCRYVDQQEISVTDACKIEASSSSTEAGFAFRQYQSPCDLDLEKVGMHFESFCVSQRFYCAG